MGVDRAQKQPAASLVANQDHGQERKHDQGMLHAAQVERQRGSKVATKPAADSLSGEAMNDALMLVGFSLHRALKKSELALKAGGLQVSIYNQNIEDEHGALETAQGQYDHQLGLANPSKQATNRLLRSIDEHGDNLKSARQEKRDYVAGVRDRVFEPLLRDPVRRLQDIAAEAQYFGWSGDQHAKVAAGANYLRTMVREVHDLGKNLELDGSPSLQALDKALDDIVRNMNLTLADADPRELESVDPYLLTQKSILDNLIAAEAQARNAHAALRAWTGGHGKPVDFAHIRGATQAIEYHLSDATELLAQLKPADRHQFKAMLHGLTREVLALHRAGRIQDNGRARAGSASMEIDSFPHFLGELETAIGS